MLMLSNRFERKVSAVIKGEEEEKESSTEMAFRICSLLTFRVVIFYTERLDDDNSKINQLVVQEIVM